jgi:hypothetical protein
MEWIKVDEKTASDHYFSLPDLPLYHISIWVRLYPPGLMDYNNEYAIAADVFQFGNNL